jgi:hypothetical protein
MAFDNIILGLIGIGCVWYLARKVKSAVRGEPGCSGCSSCPSSKNGCCGSGPDQQERHVK